MVKAFRETLDDRRPRAGQHAHRRLPAGGQARGGRDGDARPLPVSRQRSKCDEAPVRADRGFVHVAGHDSGSCQARAGRAPGRKVARRVAPETFACRRSRTVWFEGEDVPTGRAIRSPLVLLSLAATPSGGTRLTHARPDGRDQVRCHGGPWIPARDHGSFVARHGGRSQTTIGSGGRSTGPDSAPVEPVRTQECNPMSTTLDEVLAANGAYADSFGARAELPLPPARRFADPDLHGCPARPGEVRRSERGRRARHPQCRRARQRRRHPLARHLVQAARHGRVVRHPPHRLRHGVLHRRGDPRSPRQQPRDRRPRPERLLRRRRRPGLARGRLHRLADHRRPDAAASPTTSGGSGPTRWCRPASRSTASSTTSAPGASAEVPEATTLGRAA